jgi:uncharacterized protein with PIN domain
MLGSLARWLRFFGFDCAYCDVTMDDSKVALQAQREGRWLLTRDRELASTGPPRTTLVRSENLDDQLREVFQRFDLRPEAGLDASRCAECNGELVDVSREDVAAEVPPFVLATAERFRRCTGCRHIYWPGTHGERIVAQMKRICAANSEF